MITKGPQNRGESVLTDVDLSPEQGEWITKRPKYPLSPAAEAGFQFYMEEVDKDEVLARTIPETRLLEDNDGLYFLQKRVKVDPRFPNMEIPGKPGMFDPMQTDIEQVADIIDIVNSSVAVYVRSFGIWAVRGEFERTQNTGLIPELNPDGFIRDEESVIHMVDVNPILYQSVDAVRDMLDVKYGVLSVVTNIAIRNSGLTGGLRRIDPCPEKAHQTLPLFELAA